MRTPRERAKLARHGLRLNTPAPRVQEVRKYPTRTQMRAEIQRIHRGLPAEAYSEDWV